ncbi:GCN5-related N-acetyltransferase [Burkholderia sp. H160]|nr:GCN5-related N-acetyltransferase [Burkholderia sp. H160]
MSTDSTSDQGEPLTLRAIGVRDAKQLHALIYAPSMSHGDPQTPFHSVESTREWIEKRPPQHIEIGAWVGEQLIGHAQIEVGRTRRAHVGAIGVGVHGDRRRRGVATRLVGEVIDLADNWLGLRRLELKVFVDNDAAIALYRKSGFEIEGQLRGYMLRQGVLVDAYLMGRLSAPLPHITE